MSYTVSALAANTAQITASNTGSNASNWNTIKGTNGLIKVVQDAIEGTSPSRSTGWSLYDTVDTVTISSDTYNTPVITQVYRCLNKDGISYKYAILRWNLDLLEINTSTCESWDNTTHSVTNEAWTYYNSAPIPFRTDGMDMLVFCNPRYIAFQSYLNGEPSNWAGVFEVAREDLADTSSNGYPCWGWMSSTLLNIGSTGGINSCPLGGTENTLINFPRTRSGATSFNAAKGWAADYGVTQYPQWLNGTVPGFNYYLGSAGAKFLANAWDTTKRLVLPIKPIFDYNKTYISNYGQIYGLKMLAPAGDNMNKIKINVDSDNNYSPSGTLTDHWLLNTYGKSLGTGGADLGNLQGNTDWTATAVTVGAGNRIDFMISTGAFYYAVTGGSQTIVKISQSLFTTTTLVTTTSGFGSTFRDIKYDGERYVYVGSNLGIIRIDTITDTINYIALTNGCSTMQITPYWIWSFPFTTNTAITINRIAVGELFTAVNSVTLSVAVTTATTIVTSAIDSLGYLYFATFNGTTTSDNKIYKIAPGNSPTTTTLLSNPITCQNAALQIIDEKTMLYWCAVQATTIQRSVIDLNTFNNIGSVSTSSMSTATLNTPKRLTPIKIDANILVCPQASALTTVGSAFSLGGTNTGLLPAITATSDLCNSSAFIGTLTNQMIWTDGTKIAVNTDAGIRIYTKIHTYRPFTNISIGQIAIPA